MAISIGDDDNAAGRPLGAGSRDPYERASVRVEGVPLKIYETRPDPDFRRHLLAQSW